MGCKTARSVKQPAAHLVPAQHEGVHKASGVLLSEDKSDVVGWLGDEGGC